MIIERYNEQFLLNFSYICQKRLKMTTFKISVKNKRDAILLFRMLQKVSFVDKIEKSEASVSPGSGNQFNRIRKILKNKADSGLFKGIDDPVKWQREQRDEWE